MPNEQVNKVIYGDTTLIDLTSDSVEASDVLSGVTFHDAAGVRQVGTLNIVDVVYPVGSIYMSVNSTSPATLFGGTWERIQDTFLLSAGTTYEAGSTGGEAEHTLTISEMPEHQHSVYYRSIYSRASSSGYAGAVYKMDEASQSTAANGTGARGGGAAHNNMPPYLTVYVWKRTN